MDEFLRGPVAFSCNVKCVSPSATPLLGNRPCVFICNSIYQLKYYSNNQPSLRYFIGLSLYYKFEMDYD